MGILIDNAVDKMSRIDADADINIYNNILGFIDRHKKVFFTKDKKWNGKGGYVGQLDYEGGQYIIRIRVNKLAEWVLVHGGKLSDDELTDCMERLESAKNKNAAKEILLEIFGNVVLDGFDVLVSKKYKDKITWHEGKSDRGANNVTLAEIIVKDNSIDGTGMKDSDQKESKENDDETA